MTSKKKDVDLKLKVGSKEQVLWESVKKEAKVLIEQSEQNLIVQNAILEMANKKIQEEEKKWHSKQH